ncbi:MAG: AMP-binding protein, partial [Gammaproteobacteria bacterium]
MPEVRTLIDPLESDFDGVHRQFAWSIPETFNMAHWVCDRHADGTSRMALWCESERGDTSSYTFDDLQRSSNQLAHALLGLGVTRGDRIAILLPQRVETGLAHLAAWKIGAMSLPLSILFGVDALKFRLMDSGARVVITTASATEQLAELKRDLPDLEFIIDCDDLTNGFWPLLDKASDQLNPVDTLADDPALVIYTSGTTGPPKGAVLAHRC